MIKFCLLLVLIPVLGLCEDMPCERPKQLTEFEEACKTDPEVTGNSGTFLENLQENLHAAFEETKRLFNLAKKRLGIKSNEQPSNEQNKKCEYYQCIFRKMDTLGGNTYPNMTLMENWVNDNVADFLKGTTLTKIDSCFNAIAINIANSEYGSTLEQSDSKILKIDNDQSDYPPESTASTVMTSCEVSSKLMMCLNTATSCSIFVYP